MKNTFFTFVIIISSYQSYAQDANFSSVSINYNNPNGQGLTIYNSNNSAYSTLQVNGSNGYTVPNWANSTVFESVPASTGGFVLSSYTGNINFQTNNRNNRMTITSTGNVGIGTTTPSTPLFVTGGGAMTSGWNKTATLKSTFPVLIFNSNDSKWGGLGYDYSSGLNLWVNASSDDLSGTGNAPFHISNAGNISLGNGNAAFKLNVNGETSFTQFLHLTSNDQEIKLYRDGSAYGYLWSSGLGLHWGKGSNSNSITIDNNGNAGVGTVDTKGYKLAVNGKIRAQEIKVEASPWPDYVFTKDYNLPSLQETEKHIKEKGHLPGIPSTAEVKANGIDLGEMNAKLLQKIEELTLHLIEMNKKAEQQQLDINYLKSKLK
jgi:hypothetical protein